MPVLVEVWRPDVSGDGVATGVRGPRDGRLDLLVNNAGDMGIPARRTADSESKLKIVLFSLELQRRLTARSARSWPNPGIATTTLAAHSPDGFGETGQPCT
jgi:hypothetical protein